ncbi:hypothetical protein LINPERHAP1_LOCUS27288 [Linum perenne]
MLAQHLAQLHLVVSPQGYCFQDVSEHGMYVDLEIHYLRLNDLFCWSHHGVESMASTTNTVWTRSELKHPVRKGENLLVKPMTRCVVVREDKYKELKGMLRNRDDEMEEMKEDNEIAKLTREKEEAIVAKDEEMTKLTREKEETIIVAIANLTREKEIAIVTKDEEVEKLRRETETAIVAKDEEVEKLRMETEAAIIAKDEEVKKDEEVEKLRREIEATTVAKYEEVEKLKRETEVTIVAKDEEVKKLRKEKHAVSVAKNEEVEKLTREKEAVIVAKDEEVEKLTREKEVVIVAKNEEVEKLRRGTEAIILAKNEEMNKKNEELEKLTREKEAAIIAKDEEMNKLTREKNTELRKTLREKNQDIRVLIDKHDDELDKKDEETKKKDEEIERLKKEKKEEEAKTKKVVEELAKCQKQPSWAFLPSTKLVRQNSETKQKYLERRQRVPPGTFSLFTNFGFPYVSNSANLVDNMSVNSMEYVNLIDEPESNIKEWPPLPTQYVYIGKGSTLDFDTNDWWYLKTTHPEGGLTMLVYYEGKRSQFSHGDKDTDPIIPLPFLKDAQVYSILSKFSLFNLSFGARLGYMYRK